MLGLSQKEMAERIGIADKTYNKKELNPSSFKVGEVDKILDISGLDYRQIIFLPNKFTTVNK